MRLVAVFLLIFLFVVPSTGQEHPCNTHDDCRGVVCPPGYIASCVPLASRPEGYNGVCSCERLDKESQKTDYAFVILAGALIAAAIYFIRRRRRAGGEQYSEYSGG